MLWNRIIWTVEIRINLCLMSKVKTRKGKMSKAYGHIWLPVEVAYWFIDDMTADRNRKMNSQTCTASAERQKQRFTVLVANGPKHTAKATQGFLKTKKLNILKRPSHLFPLNSTEDALKMLKNKAEGRKAFNRSSN